MSIREMDAVATQVNGRFLISAPNIHCGGGLVLLKEMLAVWPGHVQLVAWLDERARREIEGELPKDASVYWVRPSILSRLCAEMSLARKARQGDRLLCFNGLPPVFGNRAVVDLFQQNRMIIDRSSLSGFGARVRWRIRLERLLGYLFRGRVNRYWVQTPTMARILKQWYGPDSVNTMICPFVPPGRGAARSGKAKWDFLYVADGGRHKNHRVLVEAWMLLARQGVTPSLALTLSERDQELWRWIEAQASKQGLRIENAGELDHRDVLELYSNVEALIYPSKTESFGLPLLEAREADLPILAGELDFVRDVCDPVQTFDPSSPVSIARAVGRFMGSPEAPVETVEAAEFLSSLMFGRSLSS